MNIQSKSMDSILAKLRIRKLNEMQEQAYEAILSEPEVVLLSPTGTGKTLAFLLPLLEELIPDQKEIQALIIAPSRELVVQIENVLREMGTGYKVNSVYGGRAGSKDREELQHTPAILIGTPGRVADHIRRGNIITSEIRTLVLDEFDKSLEIGFEEEMREIMDALTKVDKKILTSATQKVEIPRFTRIKNPKVISFLKDGVTRLQLKLIISHSKDKFVILRRLLGKLKGKQGIIFCSLKETIHGVSHELSRHHIDYSTFHGGLEQLQRERALIKFRNKTASVLVASDLAARGIDVPELDFIIHFEVPQRADEFTHRNGRTARMNSKGTAYIIQWENEELPEFIADYEEIEVNEQHDFSPSKWSTLYISGGRKDKISKGDIAGLFLKQGQLQRDELGHIELKTDCAYVAVPKHKTTELIEKLNNSRLKKKKVRISILK